jgi:hypothetical protein
MSLEQTGLMGSAGWSIGRHGDQLSIVILASGFHGFTVAPGKADFGTFVHAFAGTECFWRWLGRALPLRSCVGASGQ